MATRAGRPNPCHQLGRENNSGLCTAGSTNQDEDISFAEEMQSGMLTLDNCNMQKANLQLDVGALKKRPIGNGLLEGFLKETMFSPAYIDGKEVNLLQLWIDVLANGGYQKVTDMAMWPSLSETLGFGKTYGTALKMVYAMHLNMYESRHTLKSGRHLGDNVGCLVSKSIEESSTGLVDGNVVVGERSNPPNSNDCQVERIVEIPSKGQKLSFVKGGHAGGGSSSGKMAWTPTGADMFAEMIKWIKWLALHLGDPKESQGSKQNESWMESSCSTMVMKVRMVLWGRKEQIHYGGLSGNMAKPKIPPRVYYKELPKPNANAMEKLRANQTRAMKCGLRLLGDPSDGQDIRSAWSCQTPGLLPGGSGHCGEYGLDLSSAYLKSMSETLSMGYLNNKASRKRIPIGPQFQAQIRPCTRNSGEVGEASGSSNTDFSGTTVWPIPGSKSTTSDNPLVGVGRHLTCTCQDPMSVACVRLHIREAREKLKEKLGEAYASWGFDHMGEIVAEYWTKQEEHVFDLTVKLNRASLDKNFWDQLPIALPSKTVKGLVSYYFNVFVVRRRAIENRTMPDSVDSDDDERDLVINIHGSSYGNNAMLGYWKDAMIPAYFRLSHGREIMSFPAMPVGEK